MKLFLKILTLFIAIGAVGGAVMMWMDTSGFIKPARIPATRLPMIAFIWVTSGEVLLDVDGSPYLCQSGQLLLIPDLYISGIGDASEGGGVPEGGHHP